MVVETFTVVIVTEITVTVITVTEVAVTITTVKVSNLFYI